MKNSNIAELSNIELLINTKHAAATEKLATLALLEHLAEIESRRLFAERAFSSLFEYVVKELGYSESQAAERINAMRLVKQVSEVKEQIQAGELTMTAASQIHRFFKAERKNTHKD